MDCQPARRLLICAESAGARRAERPVADDRSRGSSLGARRTIQGVGSGEFEPMGAELPGSVPVIDIAGLRSGAIEERRAVAREIDRACRTIGFFYIRNHGVDEALIQELVAASRAFFALPLADKMAIASTNSPHFRGYVPLAAEEHNPGHGRDWHEALDFGREPRPGMEPDAGFYGPNQWPPAMPSLRPVVERYYGAMLGLSMDLLRGFALALELEEEYFLPKFDWAAGWLRLLHYPPQPENGSTDGIGIGEHTDYDAFTILWQDMNGGLEVHRLDGTWIQAPPIPGTFVINIANLMQRWTNDLYRSTPHRAINRSKADRTSIPFFVNANPETVVECLPNCGPALYPPITALEWVRARVLESQPFRQEAAE